MYKSRNVRHRRPAAVSSSSLVVFLFVACFGILFAGCGTPPADDTLEQFTFTEDDIAEFRRLASSAASGAVSSVAPTLVQTGATSSIPVLDLSMVTQYSAMRSGPASAGENVYRVTNAFVNVRSAPSATASQTAKLVKGDAVRLVEFTDAAWAKVQLQGGADGFVSTRYIAKLTTEEALAREKQQYQGTYFVNFAFLNIRKNPETGSEKIGELPGQAIVKPISMEGDWARVSYQGKEGYVSTQYLQPFLPAFLVRQDSFTLPILLYRFNSPEAEKQLGEHIDALKAAGVRFTTLKNFRDLVVAQEERDVRLDPKSVVVGITDADSAALRRASDVLSARGVTATLFLRTADLGLHGITEQQMLTLGANGFDLQSAGHTGDDLRSMTNTQVQLELAQSRKLIEEKTKKPVFAIAYGLGGNNQRVEQMAGDSGYLFGVSANPTRAFTRGEFLRLPSFVISTGVTAQNAVGMVLGEASTK